MAEDKILSNLNKIIELSSSMLDVARKGYWERVQEIELQRRQVLEQTFPLDTDSINNVPAVAMQVQKISDLDKETISLVAASREELSALAGKISTGRQAVNAYLDIQNR